MALVLARLGCLCPVVPRTMLVGVMCVGVVCLGREGGTEGGGGRGRVCRACLVLGPFTS
jgi:hypothetical protein